MHGILPIQLSNKINKALFTCNKPFVLLTYILKLVLIIKTFLCKKYSYAVGKLINWFKIGLSRFICNMHL